MTTLMPGRITAAHLVDERLLDVDQDIEIEVRRRVPALYAREPVITAESRSGSGQACRRRLSVAAGRRRTGSR
ncbi:hypothetical protein [Kribbella sp. NBC_00359]|uniref:hypothetical protein n=1 Tax=Kribbella sp. NBC_00359 TaxID=2975966 RepID=UPI002E2141DE